MTADPCRSIKEWMTLPEIAREIRIRQATVAGWIRSGALPAYDVSTGRRPRYRIRRADLDAFLERRAVVPTPATPIRRPRRQEVPRYV